MYYYDNLVWCLCLQELESVYLDVSTMVADCILQGADIVAAKVSISGPTPHHPPSSLVLCLYIITYLHMWGRSCTLVGLHLISII